MQGPRGALFLMSEVLMYGGRQGAGLERQGALERFRGGLVFKAHRLCVSLNSRLESNTEEEEGALGELGWTPEFRCQSNPGIMHPPTVLYI